MGLRNETLLIKDELNNEKFNKVIHVFIINKLIKIYVI